jgi:putative transposase
MALWRLFYHIVWATRDREPLINPAVEMTVYGYIIGKANALGGIPHAIGGIADHLHVVVSIPPAVAISTFVKGLKGSSAHYLNQRYQNNQTFGWQRGYGVFSLGQLQLEMAVEYVLRQKEHHAAGSLIASLEQEPPVDDLPAAWNNGKALADITIVNDNTP